MIQMKRSYQKKAAQTGQKNELSEVLYIEEEQEEIKGPRKRDKKGKTKRSQDISADQSFDRVNQSESEIAKSPKGLNVAGNSH